VVRSLFAKRASKRGRAGTPREAGGLPSAVWPAALLRKPQSLGRHCCSSVHIVSTPTPLSRCIASREAPSRCTSQPLPGMRMWGMRTLRAVDRAGTYLYTSSDLTKSMASRSGFSKRNPPKSAHHGTGASGEARSSPAAIAESVSQRPTFLEIVEATRAFIGDALDEKRLRRVARLEELEGRCAKLEHMLEDINPFCGDDTWMRRRESLERRIAETQKERFRVELDLLEDPLERELFELKKRLRMLGEEAGSDG